MKCDSPATAAIKEYAADLEIDKVGICDALPLERTRKSFETAISMGYIPPEVIPRDSTILRITTPTQHLEGGRFIISACQSYYSAESQEGRPHEGIVAGYTRCNHYKDLKGRLGQLAAFMRREFSCQTRVFSCYVTLAEKPIAVKAGLGFYGKSGVIVTPEYGSFVVLGEIITDLELDPDRKLDIGCGECRRCIDACPTGALGTPYFVDRKICIQYLSERRAVIPQSIREVWGRRLYGCTTCQDVCPYNRDLSPTQRIVSCGRVGAFVPLDEVILISEGAFLDRFGDNQIGRRETAAIRRNAIIAAGNSGSEILLEPLMAAATDPDPMIRQHSLWAISRLEGNPSRSFLRKALDHEEDGLVRDEIETLLDGFS